MPRPALWTAIGDALRAQIAGGQYRAGEKLPTEAQLAARFGVNRHTVRRALAELATEGAVYARRGAGVFVAQATTDYPIGRRVRFHQNLLAAGRAPSRQMLLLETRGADPREAEALGLDAGEPVQVCEGLSLADDAPIALFRSVFPAARFPGILERLRAENSVTRALAACGVEDYTRAYTRIVAKPAEPTMAAQLRLAPGSPLLRTTSLNVDGARRPVEYGTTWFAGERVTLVHESDG